MPRSPAARRRRRAPHRARAGPGSERCSSRSTSRCGAARTPEAASTCSVARCSTATRASSCRPSMLVGEEFDVGVFRRADHVGACWATRWPISLPDTSRMRSAPSNAASRDAPCWRSRRCRSRTRRDRPGRRWRCTGQWRRCRLVRCRSSRSDSTTSRPRWPLVPARRIVVMGVPSCEWLTEAQRTRCQRIPNHGHPLRWRYLPGGNHDALHSPRHIPITCSSDCPSRIVLDHDEQMGCPGAGGPG